MEPSSDAEVKTHFIYAATLIGSPLASEPRRLVAPVLRAAHSYQRVMQCSPNPPLTTIFDAVLISNRQNVCRSGPHIRTEGAAEPSQHLPTPSPPRVSSPPTGAEGETLTHWTHAASCMIMAALLLAKEGCQLTLPPAASAFTFLARLSRHPIPRLSFLLPPAPPRP